MKLYDTHVYRLLLEISKREDLVELLIMLFDEVLRGPVQSRAGAIDGVAGAIEAFAIYSGNELVWHAL